MMRPRSRSAAAVLLSSLGLLAPVVVAAAPVVALDDAPEPAADYVAYPDAPAVTRHAVALGGESREYEAEAGTLTLVDEKRAPTARIFYIAYRLVTADEAAARARPILFSFNGGPGSSSVWLHLGLFGPRRVDFADDFGNPGPPPYRLTANVQTLLDVADLVFIDPVSTGFSRPEGETRAGTFHGVEPDIESVAEFIRRYVTRTGRWGSPKFIAGESYGTTRAAGLAETLWRTHGMALNGVILVSSVLDFATVRFNAGNDLPYPLFLPTYAAIAHHHGVLAPDLQARPLAEVLAEVEAFAMNDYAAALREGDGLAPERRDDIARRIARASGLSPEFVLRSRLRVSQGAFCKELLRSRSLVVGRLDGRFAAPDHGDDAGDSPGYDPSYAAIRGNFTAALNQLVREELGYESDLPYEILTSVQPWEFGRAADNRYLNVGDRLARAMIEQPALRVFVASGIHDLATPHFATDHTIAHMGLPSERRALVTVQRYEAGHMMYIQAQERDRLLRELRAFVVQEAP